MGAQPDDVVIISGNLLKLATHSPRKVRKGIGVANWVCRKPTAPSQPHPQYSKVHDPGRVMNLSEYPCRSLEKDETPLISNVLTEFRAIYCSGAFVPEADAVVALSLLFEKVRLPNNIEMVHSFATRYRLTNSSREQISENVKVESEGGEDPFADLSLSSGRQQGFTTFGHLASPIEIRNCSERYSSRRCSPETKSSKWSSSNKEAPAS